MLRHAGQVIKLDGLAVEGEIVEFTSFHRLADALFGNSGQDIHRPPFCTQPTPGERVTQPLSTRSHGNATSHVIILTYQPPRAYRPCHSPATAWRWAPVAPRTRHAVGGWLR